MRFKYHSVIAVTFECLPQVRKTVDDETVKQKRSKSSTLSRLSSYSAVVGMEFMISNAETPSLSARTARELGAGLAALTTCVMSMMHNEALRDRQHNSHH